MAKINESTMRKWADGDVIHGPDYNNERDLIVKATNDTQDQVNVLKGAGGIATAQLQDGAVTTSKILDGAVTLQKLAPASVDNTRLADRSVTNSKIVDSTITGPKLVDESISTPKLADNAVTTAKITDGSITTAKIGNNAVQTSNIENAAVTADKLFRDSVTNAKIQNFAVTTDKINTGAVTSEKLGEGAVTPSKIVEGAVTQFSYTKAETNAAIQAAIQGGLPQDVIDQIIASIGDVDSQSVNALGYDALLPVNGPEEMPGGITFSIINGTDNANAWLASASLSANLFEPILVRVTVDASDAICGVQELFLSSTTTRLPIVGKRVASSGTSGTWSAWTFEETTAGAQAKADAAKNAANAYATEVILPQANTNAQNYANANFRKPSEMLQANIIKNSTAAQGFNYWNVVSGPWNTYLNQYVGSYFAISGIAVSDVDYLLLENEAVGVSPGAQYLLQAVLHSGGSYANSRIYVEMYNPATGAPLDSVQADNQKWWHRKTKIVTIPAGISAVKLRLVVNNVPANMTAGFSRIMLTEGTLDVPYSQEMDIRALYEQNEAVKQSGVDAKNGIVGAISAKGVSASTNDTWATLATKIGQIQQGAYSSLVPSVSSGSTYLAAGQTGWVRDFAGVPANAKTISLLSTTGPSAWGIRTSGTMFSLAFGLKDANGLIWRLSQSVYGAVTNSNALSMYALQADLSAGVASSLHLLSASNWALYEVTPQNNVGSVTHYGAPAKPAGFDSTRDMVLGVYITGTTGSNSTFNSYASNLRLQTT